MCGNNTACPALFCIPFTTSTVTSHSPSSVLLQCQCVLYYASACFDNQEIVFYSYFPWALQTVTAKNSLLCL